MKKVIELLFVLTCLLAIPLSAQAHKARYHSIFIYNFCKYIEWPEGETDKIIIGVFGSVEVTQILQQMADRNKGKGLNIEVLPITTLSSVEKCNVVYVAFEESERMHEIIQATNSKPILLITDNPGSAYLGSVINFTERDGGVRFELNQKSASERGLKISECLLKLAILV
jgi:hypothetical protein